MNTLPAHLSRYLRDQDYSRYTAKDQAVWRYILRQLTAYLAKNAHPIYMEGLKNTGISVEEIPRIDRMSECLEKYGWRAVAVSGFIPPAAFMELQAYGCLPIACDMRTVDHIEYTPAPDIVHEAAGHAPILVDPEFAAYLKAYAQVARRAILSKWDLDQYAAIRELSDLKESPASTPEMIRASEERLNQVNAAIPFVSEGGYLSRMNWWTAEYGLIGDLARPKIFGAGLLSSIGESQWCLSDRVKKIPLTKDCLNYSYDITEPQPQLFVTPSFGHLTVVLEEMAATMAFRVGGLAGLAKAFRSQAVNTVVFNSGLQISGQLIGVGPLVDHLADGPQVQSLPSADYLRFQGPCQLAYGDQEISGQGCGQHPHGFGSPVGRLRDGVALSELNQSQLAARGIQVGQKAHLEYQSGVVVAGEIQSLHFENGRALIVTWKDCRVTWGGQLLFDPAWGVFDMAVGEEVVSVFGGAADRGRYGSSADFPVTTVPEKPLDPLRRRRLEMYARVRQLRQNQAPSVESMRAELESLFEELEREHPNDWLLNLEILELTQSPGFRGSQLRRAVSDRLEALACQRPELTSRIQDGVRLMGS